MTNVLLLNRMIDEGRELLDDGDGNDEAHFEYRRGLCEFAARLCIACGIALDTPEGPMEFTDEYAAELLRQMFPKKYKNFSAAHKAL
jgi:hypothetical protein